MTSKIHQWQTDTRSYTLTRSNWETQDYAAQLQSLEETNRRAKLSDHATEHPSFHDVVSKGYQRRYTRDGDSAGVANISKGNRERIADVLTDTQAEMSRVANLPPMSATTRSAFSGNASNSDTSMTTSQGGRSASQEGTAFTHADWTEVQRALQSYASALAISELSERTNRRPGPELAPFLGGSDSGSGSGTESRSVNAPYRFFYGSGILGGTFDMQAIPVHLHLYWMDHDKVEEDRKIREAMRANGYEIPDWSEFGRMTE